MAFTQEIALRVSARPTKPGGLYPALLLSDLVRPDIELTGIDVVTGTVRTRSVIETANCADCILLRQLRLHCILPCQLLPLPEEIVTARLRCSVPGVADGVD